MKQLSIIVPIYNVEDYVHRCLESIFRQGMNDDFFEVILMNDGTPDKSMEVIADIIGAHQNIQIITQMNQGLSIARNNGLQVATGEYIQFLDSDDLLIENTLPFLLSKAISSKADLVVADFIKMNNDEIAKFSSQTLTQKGGNVEEKTGMDLLAQKPREGYSCVWHTLYRRAFLNNNNIRFIPHIYFEDTPFTYQCYLKAGMCLRVNWQYIIYRARDHSITSSFSKEKGRNYSVVITQIWAMSQQDSLSYELKLKLQDDVFGFFSMLLYRLSSCRAIPFVEKMQVLHYINELVPDLSFRNGFKQRIVTFLYQKMPSVYMTLRVIYANHIQLLFWRLRNTAKHKET